MLKDAFHFMDEDLLANKSGKISTQQQQQRIPLPTILMATVPFVIMLGVEVIFVILTATGDRSSIFGVVGLPVALYVWATVVLRQLISLKKRLSYIKSAEAIRYKSNVNKRHIELYNKVQSYFDDEIYYISDTTITLLLNQEQYDALEDELIYTFYYVENEKIQKGGKRQGIILSVEAQKV